jgi:hypothetical protein
VTALGRLAGRGPRHFRRLGRDLLVGLQALDGAGDHDQGDEQGGELQLGAAQERLDGRGRGGPLVYALVLAEQGDEEVSAFLTALIPR